MMDNTPTQPRLWADGKTVDLDGTVYKQTPIRELDRERGPSPDPCCHCVAYSNMSLCDLICPYCKFGFVFVLRRKQKC